MEKTIKLLMTTALVIFVISCGTTKKAENLPDISDEEKAVFSQTVGDTIQIANEETEYEIIIIEPGFNSWLLSIAKPEGYYSQSYLENRNQIYVTNWNQRVLQPQQYNSRLYELQIDYSPHIDYGYEVNYKLYNYFIYFQRKYRQRLGPFLPRI
ncbi:hypothetical protein JQC67_12190 [Aurantibacter crassamenti]|uniref:DUF6146 family protein n=1 Tax=Aurantibacter crassamenti TaxID=1837375 RepID=UPI0019396B51|nr:DUF6146 family protein [Aurantibacter crassamenti]MBM1106902.1 hypothetical protein [Aurantibacter crassamenti]